MKYARVLAPALVLFAVFSVARAQQEVDPTHYPLTGSVQPSAHAQTTPRTAKQATLRHTVHPTTKKAQKPSAGSAGHSSAVKTVSQRQ